MTAYQRPTSAAFASPLPHVRPTTFNFNRLAPHPIPISPLSSFPLHRSVRSSRRVISLTYKQPRTPDPTSSYPPTQPPPPPSSSSPPPFSATPTSSSTTPPALSRRHFLSTFLVATLAAAAPPLLSSSLFFLNPSPVLAARPEGVNRPELLPTDFTTVIDLERFLASGEAKRLRDKISDLETRTGIKLRILTQRFPQTPGLAIRDYWGVDADTIVCVADYFGGSGQLLKFNVGANVDRVLAPRFWSVLSASYGNKFYVSKNGEAASILNAVDAIRYCLLKDGCVTPPRDITEVIF